MFNRDWVFLADFKNHIDICTPNKLIWNDDYGLNQKILQVTEK